MSKNDMKQDAAMVHKHEKHLHPGKPMTKFAKGGVTNDQRKQLGRNAAKLKNQGRGM